MAQRKPPKAKKRQFNPEGKESIFGQATVQSLKEVKDLASEFQETLKDLNLDDLDGDMKNIAQGAKDMSEAMSKSVEYSDKNKENAKDRAKAASLGMKYATKEGGFLKTGLALRIKWLKSSETYTKGLQEQVASSQSLLSNLSNMKEMQSKAGEAANALDQGFEGIGSTIRQFVTNPLWLLSH